MSAGPNPSGLCMCGCGRKTPLATYHNNRTGIVKGHPIRYLLGHGKCVSIAQRVATTHEVRDCGYLTPCWVWQGTIGDHGYGSFTHLRKHHLAHRASYELHAGPIPRGLQIDHLCRVRACVNPEHLEPVTPAENTHRGAKAKLSAPIAAAIRASDESNAALARRYGVHDSQISRVRTRAIWREVA